MLPQWIIGMGRAITHDSNSSFRTESFYDPDKQHDKILYANSGDGNHARKWNAWLLIHEHPILMMFDFILEPTIPLQILVFVNEYTVKFYKGIIRGGE
jgi:hypothetical protein